MSRPPRSIPTPAIGCGIISERYQQETRCAILLASHNMGEVERLANRVLMLRQGKIVDSGSPDDLLFRYSRQNLEEVFLDIARDRRAAGEVAPNESSRDESNRGGGARLMHFSFGRVGAMCLRPLSMCCGAPGRVWSRWPIGRPCR
jgi:hypothetical protein